MTGADEDVGLVMSHTRWDYSIPLDKKITTDCDHSHTHRPMFSWFAFPSPHPRLSRTSEKSGSQRYSTTVLECLV